MDAIELELGNQYARKKKQERYAKWNIERRRLRRERNLLLYPALLIKPKNIQIIGHGEIRVLEETNQDMCVKQSIDVIDEINVENGWNILVQNNDHDVERWSATSLELLEETDDENHLNLFNSSQPDSILLHHYTSCPTVDYCESFVTFTRRANLSKLHTDNLLSLIKSGLPVPNSLPSTQKELFDLLDVQELFSKRVICLYCYTELDNKRTSCDRCPATKRNMVAYVYVTSFTLLSNFIQKAFNKKRINFHVLLFLGMMLM